MRRSFLVFAWVSLAGLGLAEAGFAQPAPVPEQGILLHRQGKLAEAAQAYREFLKHHPKSLAAQSNLAVALANLGHLEEAIVEYEKALALDPSSAPVRMNLAIAYYKQQRIPEAGRLLEEIYRADTRNEQVLLLYADCLFRMGQYDEVIRVVKPFVDTHGDHTAANYLVGMAFLRKNRPDDGQVYIDRVMKSAGEAESLYLVGASQYEAGDYPAARETLGKAVALNPELPGIHTYMAQALVETGDAEGAKRSFREALQRNPADFEANLRYGALLRVESKTAEAAPYLRAAERLNPNSVPLQYQLATLDLESNDPEAALPRLEKIVAGNPTYLEARIALARAYYRLKRREDGDRERENIRKLEAEIQRNEVKKP
jgi:tetratricopeptide (TPR) repeat protein